MQETGLNWIKVPNLPIDDKPFVVFCRALHKDIHKCIAMGTLTTHNRGIGIRPAGERNYHLDNHVTYWAYVSIPRDIAFTINPFEDEA